VDGMQTDELRDFMSTHWQPFKEALLLETYQPSAVRKMEIPKPQGGTRMLGIPTVKDRLIQQAIAQWMNGLWETDFHVNSYGFRPNKSAHQAVLQAQDYLNQGKTHVVELDLANFFDAVNHDKLMSLLAKKITDKQTLKLVGKYLRSEIMVDGVSSQRTEGTPQGSPLSPLLSNIILNELDVELTKRGLSFIRYADDCSIYVKSAKAAARVMLSITNYLEEDLLLKVNREKSKISRPLKSTLLGFSFYKTKGIWRIRIAEKSIAKMKEKLPRNQAQQVETKMKELEKVVTGWVQYFQIADIKSICKKLDELLRSRVRKLFWQKWQKTKTRMRNLIKLGVPRWRAYQWANTSKRACRTAHSPILLKSLNNEVLARKGLPNFYQKYHNNVEIQLNLF
jgi:RNA-directed DNA polymerase